MSVLDAPALAALKTGLLLGGHHHSHRDGRLTPQVINDVWNQTAAAAGVEGRTPHSAKHAMGKLLVGVPATSLPCRGSSAIGTRSTRCSTLG